MPVATITVNQWRIKSNAETGANEPVVCVNHYEWVKVVFDRKTGKPALRMWGPKIGQTMHYQEFAMPSRATNVRTIYDPASKTTCQASCWMQFNY